MGYICPLLFALALQTIRLSQTFFISTPCDDTFGKPWKPSWIANPRDDLRCNLNSHCRNESTPVKSEQFDNCCACSSCAIWEGSEIELFIEYASVLGRSLVLTDQASNKSEVYEIKHVNGDMTVIPSNLCNWDTDISLTALYSQEFESVKKIWGNIVKINFENNKIRNLTDLSCLEKLDELNMNNNRLTYISNTSFTSLTHLRKIYFSRNLIKNIDPGILSAKPLNIFEADFSHNRMSQLDVSNMLSVYPSCQVNFKTNEITKLVNEANFTLEMTKSYGPGFVSFMGNKMDTFPDFKTLLHLDDIAQMGKLISSGFDYQNIPLICDCHLEPFMSLAKPILDTLWRDYMTVTCAGPPDLKGMNVSQVDPQRLICKLKSSDCQTPECNCVDAPKNNTLHVNCQNHDPNNALKSLPTIPTSNLSDFISVDISGHKITNITNITQWANISMLNASGNDILEISKDVAKALENATVDISNNIHLTHLPQTFQYCNICKMYMSNLTIDCDCTSQWIETWLKPQKCIKKEQMFNCRLPNDEIKSALMFKSEDIQCSTSNKVPTDMLAGMTIFIAFIIIISTLIFTFRYELLIISIRLKQADRRKVLPQYHYDVFLSFNDADDNVRKWVNSMLEDNLLAAGYRVFQAGQDVTFGAERNSEVLESISKTCNFLLILSDSYLNQDNEGMRPWTENEWKYGWHNFMRDKYKNLIIINFDHISSFDVNQPQIKAFLRVGCTIDFRNQDRKIMKDICEKLGKPFYTPMKDTRGHENMNLKLPRNTIFPSISDGKPTHHLDPIKATSDNILDDPQGIKYFQNILDTDIDNNKKGSQKVQWFSPQTKGRFQCYHEDLSLKKTPHIPLFNKDKSKNYWSPSKAFNPDKMKKLSEVYERQSSIVKSSECKQKTTKYEETSTKYEETSPKSTGPSSNEAKHESGPCDHRGENVTDFTEASYKDTKNDVISNSNDKDVISQLNISMTTSERSFVTMGDYHGFSTRSLDMSSVSDTRSTEVSSNTFTTSIGSSTVSFNSITSTDISITEISEA